MTACAIKCFIAYKNKHQMFKKYSKIFDFLNRKVCTLLKLC